MPNIRSILDGIFRPEQPIVEADDDGAIDDLDAEIDAAAGDDDAGDDLGGDDLGGDDLGGDDLGDDDLGGGDLGGDDLGGGGAMGGGSFGGGDEGEEEEAAPEPEAPEATGPQPMQVDDDTKVNQMFSDTGDNAYDYGIGTESNISLASFKFSHANINPNDFMNDVEMVVGLPSNVVEDRLSPEQKEIYLKSNKEVRVKFPKISEREKNILIYNSNVPMLKYDLDNNEIELVDEEEKQAYKKVDEYISRRFGANWVDKNDAAEVLKQIKVNFSDKQAIQPNLVPADDLVPYDNEVDTLPFDKVYVDMPHYLDEFIRNNLENPEFISSSIFSALSSPYKTGMGKSNSVYVIIKGEIEEEPMDMEPEPDADAEGDEELGDEELSDDDEDLEPDLEI
jgi:hypothetical protein